jgi:hypothetical protein
MKQKKIVSFKEGDLIEVKTSYDEYDEVICEVSDDPSCFTVLKTGSVGILFKIDKSEEPCNYHVAIGDKKVILYKAYMRKLN